MSNASVSSSTNPKEVCRVHYEYADLYSTFTANLVKILHEGSAYSKTIFSAKRHSYIEYSSEILRNKNASMINERSSIYEKYIQMGHRTSLSVITSESSRIIIVCTGPRAHRVIIEKTRI